MPYKDKNKQRAYQTAFLKKRRDAWVSLNGPCSNCGGTDNLQIDHKNAVEKVSHRIWSLAESKREAELAKCQVLCTTCHKSKSAAFLDGKYKYPLALVHQVKQMYSDGMTMKNIATATGISRPQVRNMIRGIQRNMF